MTDSGVAFTDSTWSGWVGTALARTGANTDELYAIFMGDGVAAVDVRHNPTVFTIVRAVRGESFEDLVTVDGRRGFIGATFR